MSNGNDDPITDGNITIAGSDKNEDLKAALDYKKDKAAVDKGASPGDNEDADGRKAREAANSAAASPEDDEDEELSDKTDQDSEAEDGKPKKKSGWQRRVDKLTRDLNERAQELKYWREQAIQGGNKKPEDEAHTSQKKPDAAPAEKPKIENFDEYADYVEALSDWKVEQRFKDQEQKAFEATLRQESQKIADAWKERRAQAEQRYEDFHELKESNFEAKMPFAMRQLLVISEVGPDVAYYLYKNPKVFEQIANQAPLIMSKEFGRIEDKILAKVKPAERGKEEGSGVSKAPKPLESGVGGNRGRETAKPEEMSYQDFKAWRERQLKSGKR